MRHVWSMAQSCLEKVFLIFRKKLWVFFCCSWILTCLRVMTRNIATILGTIKV